MEWKIEEIIHAVTGNILVQGPHETFKNVSIDSRNVSPGCMFISITGINHKGIHFLDEVITKGALGIMVNSSDFNILDTRKVKKNNIVCIVVEDTVHALGELALYHRKRIDAKIIAITGSVGKTTTRLMISNILAQRHSIKSTTGNMNNHIGLPLTLLEAEAYHHIVILELGMSAIGEIRRLSQICQPDVGIIINVAETHLATLGNIHNIAKAKSELMEYIKPIGSIVLNTDDQLVKEMSKATGLDKVSFGTIGKADIRGRGICLTSKGTKFSLVTPVGKTEIFIPVPSRALVINALAASAVANLLGYSNDEIKTGIESFTPISGRMNIIKTKIEGLKIIDDTYNSSPLSLKSILETVSAMREHQTILAIIGDMAELGKKSELMHIEAGRLIAQSGVDRLYAIGHFADKLAEGAILAKMPANRTFIGNRQDIIKRIKRNLKQNTLVLVKGSRNMKMEKILAEMIKSLH